MVFVSMDVCVYSQVVQGSKGLRTLLITAPWTMRGNGDPPALVHSAVVRFVFGPLGRPVHMHTYKCGVWRCEGCREWGRGKLLKLYGGYDCGCCVWWRDYGVLYMMRGASCPLQGEKGVDCIEGGP